MTALQQFQSHSMLDIRDLIISRIQQVKDIQAEQVKVLTIFQPLSSIEVELQANRAILKYLTALKKNQKERIEQQGHLLNEIKSMRFLTTKTIEEVYSASLQIFAFLDNTFRTLCNNQHSPSDKLRQLFIAFFEKYQSKFNAKDIFRMLAHHITESTPFIFLGWVSEWSRIYFAEEVQIAVGNQFSRHQEQMRRLNSLRNFVMNHKQKNVNPFSNSSSIPRGQQQISILSLTNKQSVFGLFLQQLTQYYKSFPLDDLDFNFIKSMRKIHCKGNEFQNEENLNKAVEIIIQSKNKHIKEQIDQYQLQCDVYIEKNTNSIFKVRKSESSLKKKAPSRSSCQKDSKLQLKKPFSFQKFFERVKSESKDQQPLNCQKRNSLLLCPKANEISFESSKQIMKNIRKQRIRKEFQLPQIGQNTRALSNPSNLQKKQTNALFGPLNRSMISNYEKQLLRNSIPSKCYEFKGGPKQKVLQRHKYVKYSQNARLQIEQNPQFSKRQREQSRNNRKIMLQLLRQKNRHAFLDK